MQSYIKMPSGKISLSDGDKLGGMEQEKYGKPIVTGL